MKLAKKRTSQITAMKSNLSKIALAKYFSQNQNSHKTRTLWIFLCVSISFVRENFRESIENLKYKIWTLVVVLATLRQQSDQNLPIQLRMPLPNDSKWQQQQQFRHQLKLMERQETKVYLSQVSWKDNFSEYCLCRIRRLIFSWQSLSYVTEFQFEAMMKITRFILHK